MNTASKPRLRPNYKVSTPDASRATIVPQGFLWAVKIAGFAAVLLVASGDMSMAQFSWASRGDHTYDLHYNGESLGRLLHVYHRSQPNSETCGSTNVAMALEWDLRHKLGINARFDLTKIKSWVDTNKDGGVSGKELEAALEVAGEVLNEHHSSNHLSESWRERGDEDEDALSINVAEVWYRMVRSMSAVPMVGNVDHWFAQIARRGNHWYLAKGAFNLSVFFEGDNVIGLMINDTVYKAKDYSHLQDRAIKPFTLVYGTALADIWQKTGASGEKARRFYTSNKRHR